MLSVSSWTQGRRIRAPRQFSNMPSSDLGSGVAGGVKTTVGRDIQPEEGCAALGSRCSVKPLPQIPSFLTSTDKRANLKIPDLHLHCYWWKGCLYSFATSKRGTACIARENGSKLWQPWVADAFWQKAAVIFHNSLPRVYPEARDQWRFPLPLAPPKGFWQKKEWSKSLCAFINLSILLEDLRL